MMKHLQFKGNIPFMGFLNLPLSSYPHSYTDVNLDLHEPSGLSAKHLAVLKNSA